MPRNDFAAKAKEAATSELGRNGKDDRIQNTDFRIQMVLSEF